MKTREGVLRNLLEARSRTQGELRAMQNLDGGWLAEAGKVDLFSRSSIERLGCSDVVCPCYWSPRESLTPVLKTMCIKALPIDGAS